MVRTATLDLNSRGSFVDDLNSKPGIVMCRDALLHRSHEIQPAFFDLERKAFAFFFIFFFSKLGTRPLLAFSVRFFCAKFSRSNFCHGKSQKRSDPAQRLQQKVYSLHFKKSFDRHPKHTFSAFWLRSSVVSVLISLISGTSTKVDMMIKCLFEAFD